MHLEKVLRQIRSGPQGPAVGVFFDFDNAVMHGCSVSRFRGKKFSGALTRWNRLRILLAGLGARWSPPNEWADKLPHEICRGRAIGDVVTLSQELYVGDLAGRVYPEARELIRAHKGAGHTVVIATPASPIQTDAMATDLGVGLLCTQTAAIDGVCTGTMSGPAMRKSAKAEGVKQFAAEAGIDLALSYGYSHDVGDEVLLANMGYAYVVNPGRRLASIARRAGWPRLSFAARGRLSGYRLLRTGMGLAAVAGGAAAALIAQPRNNRPAAAGRLCVWTSSAGFWGAGVKVQVRGAEYARAPRPAVFLFNHQSQLDALVIAYVIRTGFTAVAKVEARKYPLFGFLLRFIGATFIDRNAAADAIRALQPVVETLKSGVSIAIAPEGQVSPSDRLRPFKKGAFHLAIQAGVPVVPVVIHNSGDVLWRSSGVIQPGTVYVSILPPINTSGWTARNLETHIRDVWNLCAATLAQPWQMQAGDGKHRSAAREIGRGTMESQPPAPARRNATRVPGD